MKYTTVKCKACGELLIVNYKNYYKDIVDKDFLCYACNLDTDQAMMVEDQVEDEIE